jgi:SAM-dependent methyltransferase
MTNNNLYDEKFYRSVSTRSRKTAEIVSPMLLQIFKNPKSVLDVGCGDGVWLDEIIKLNNFSRVEAVDSEASDFKFIKNKKRIIIHKQNLEINSRLPKFEFDIVLCLEVLEHLTEETALKIAGQITNSGMILFSAATPGQGGTGHINERTHEYWDDFFAKKGFISADCIRPQIQAYSQIPSFYKNNLMVYLNTSKLPNTKINLVYLLQNSKTEIHDFRTPLTKLIHKVLSIVPTYLISQLARFKNILTKN